MSTTELKWLPIPLDLWIPTGMADYQIGWFMNILAATLRSENRGYLILCEEGCSGCSACLWKVAGAHRPDYFAQKSSLVMARFEFAQIAGRRVLYFPKAVETIKGQLSKIRNHKSRRNAISEASTGFNNGGGADSPSQTLFFDFDLDFKNQKKEKDNTLFEAQVITMREEQDFSRAEIERGARRVLGILKLPESSFRAAVAAVEIEAKRTRLSMDGIVQHLATEANRAMRRRVESEDFLEDFRAQACARRLLGILNLPARDNHISRVADVLKLEVKDTGCDLEDTTKRVTEAASEARQRGENINIFYFEDMRWRSNARLNKAEQRKLDNLAANARAKAILRGQLH
ncbi:MAG TPA: hypothetical protein VMP68_22220 [Candidatus Eisenbacteria bacterium]|nr:hypothetical protein [Candidatus Eisenbacteria bacterium]